MSGRSLWFILAAIFMLGVVSFVSGFAFNDLRYFIVASLAALPLIGVGVAVKGWPVLNPLKSKAGGT